MTCLDRPRYLRGRNGLSNRPRAKSLDRPRYLRGRNVTRKG